MSRFGWPLSLVLVGCSAGDPGISLSAAPRADNTMIADLAVDLGEPGSVWVEVWSDDVAPMRTTPTAAATQHELPLLGLRADSAYYVRATAELADGTELESEVQVFETGALPEGITPMAATGELAPGEIVLLGPALMPEPSAPGEPPPAPRSSPYLVGVDGDGEVVWYYAPEDLKEDEGRNRAVKPLPDGSLLVLLARGMRIISPDGRTLREVRNEGLDVVDLHHDAELLPNGNLVLLGSESRVMAAGPFNEPITVDGDVLLEIDADGEVVWRWSAFDHLDTDRYPTDLSLMVHDGVVDWTHANAVSYDASSDSLVVSLRHQSWVISVDRASGEVNWKLGEQGDFFLLSGEWFSAQHAATMPAADEVLLYDNGNEKGAPYSRAVAYRIDPQAGVAEEIWSWDAEMYTFTQGSAARLASGDTLVCAGGEREGGVDARIAVVDPEGETAWDLRVGEAWIYRASYVSWLEGY